MILVYHFILSTNEIFVVSYGTGYQSTYLATNNSKVPFFLPTVYRGAKAVVPYYNIFYK